MMCGNCQFWLKKTEKNKVFGLVSLTSVLGLCQNHAVMDLVNLVPNEKAINVIPHATIETDETFGCIYHIEADPFRSI